MSIFTALKLSRRIHGDYTWWKSDDVHNPDRLTIRFLPPNSFWVEETDTPEHGCNIDNFRIASGWSIK